MSDTKINHCSFCGNHKEVVKKLIVGEDVAICSECIDLCVHLIEDDTSVVKTEESKTDTEKFDPQLIKAYLDDYVIGQDNAKTVLSVAIANHYKRIHKPPKDFEITKGNVLIIGPTGSGKTLLAKTVDRKSTRLNSSHIPLSRMPSSA